jgi:hypothetical protein
MYVQNSHLGATNGIGTGVKIGARLRAAARSATSWVTVAKGCASANDAVLPYTGLWLASTNPKVAFLVHADCAADDAIATMHGVELLVSALA